MSRLLLRVLLVLLICGTATSAGINQALASGWEDRILVISSTTALAVDWATTRDMAGRYDEGYEEIGHLATFTGGKPTKDQVDTHFATLMAVNLIGNYLVQYIPSEEWMRFARYAGNLSVTFEHGPAAVNNLRLGLNIHW